MSLIYSPSDDTFFLEEILGKNLKDKNARILEVGIGSGHVLEFLKNLGFKNLVGVDINSDAVGFCRKKGFSVVGSDLFSNVKGKFDLILFNPPYLPEDKSEDKESSLATTGGKKGSEVINRFLQEAKKFLNFKGEIFLLTSSLTSGINWKGFSKELLGEKKFFFEKLRVWRVGV